MAQQCPVCLEEAEHVRIERPTDPGTQPEAGPGPHAVLEVSQLCNAEPDDQWDRICHKAAVESGMSQQMMTPVLEVYYHYFGDDAEE